MMIRVDVDRTIPLFVSRLNVGVTLTQRVTDDNWAGTEEARARADVHLQEMRTAWFVQHLGTWGINLNTVWPNLETYDWSAFDRRMDWIVSRGLENVVIGCYGAPDWAMIPNTNPKVRYGQLNPVYEVVWAHFCAVAIERAINRGVSVKIACCWNENKGDGTHGGDWDMVTYTRRYNTWYNTIRSYPNLDYVQLVGPYFPVEIDPDGVGISERDMASIATWYRGAIDADRVAVDHALSHSNTPALTREEAIRGAWSFGGIARLLKLTHPTHPVMMMEGYIQSDLKKYAEYDVDFQAAWSFERLRGELMSRWVTHSFSWGLTGDGRYAPGGCIASWLTDTRPLTGQGKDTDTGILPGDKTPLYEVYKLFHRYINPGTTIYHTRSSDPRVEAIAADVAVIVANLSESPLAVRIGIDTVELGRYEVKALVGWQL